MGVSDVLNLETKEPDRLAPLPDKEKEKKGNPYYEFVNDITWDKTFVFNSVNEKIYSNFMINRILSMFHDTLFYAFFLNRYPHLSKRDHFKFLFYSIPKKKRYIKYIKSVNIDDLKYITKYYNVTDQKGMEYLRLLSKDQITKIKEMIKPIL